MIGMFAVRAASQDALNRIHHLWCIWNINCAIRIAENALHIDDDDRRALIIDRPADWNLPHHHPPMPSCGTLTITLELSLQML